MNIGRNLQYLRRQQRLTQEQLAERMNVSRQTVSRWEADEVTPELNKLVEMCEMFSCKLDQLVREDLSGRADIYSPVTICRVAPFRMARYVIISPNPEDDVNGYMDRWARQSGIFDSHPQAVRIGWDFPFVSPEQQNRFGMRGYAAAYVLPEGFPENAPGVEYAAQAEADYAVITVQDPFAAAFERIPDAYRRIMEFLQASGCRERMQSDVLSCFEREYVRGGMTYMDVYVRADGGPRPQSHVDFR